MRNAIRPGLVVVAFAACAAGPSITPAPGAPHLPPSEHADVVASAPRGAVELGKVEVFNMPVGTDACKIQLANQAAVHLGATHVVASSSTDTDFTGHPRCIGVAYAVGR